MNDRGTQTETRIDQVRELMFGPQLRECNSRVERLELLVAHFQEEIQKRFDEVRDLLSRELDAVAASSDKKLRTVDLKAGEERAELRARVEQVEEKFDARLRALGVGLTTFQEESRKRLEALHESFSGSLNGVVEASDKRLQALAVDLQDQGADLRRQTKRTEEKLGVRLQSLTEEIESGAAHLSGALMQTQKGMQEGLQGLKMQLSDELNKSFNDVRDSKISKDDISDILVEFGMRIKGLGFNAEAQLLSIEALDKNR